MNKKTIITMMLALVAMVGQAKTFKTIKNPVAMACVNVSNGELKAREVIFRDTATTVHFTMLCRGTETQHMGAVTREWNHRVYHAFRTFAEEDADIQLHRR